MDPAHPNSMKLLTLQEAAQKLAVSVDTLLLWNKHQILTPTITLQGEIGYTEQQIAAFQLIRGALQASKINAQQAQPMAPNQLVHAQSPSNPLQAPDNSQVKDVSWQSAAISENFTSKILSPNNDNTVDKSKRLYAKIIPPLAAIVVLIIATFATKAILNQSQLYQKQGLAAQTSKFSFSQPAAAALPIALQNQQSNSKSIFKDKNPLLFAQKTDKNSPSNTKNQPPTVAGMATMAAMLKDIVSVATASSTGYASTFFAQSPCLTCVADKDSVFDASGNIKGDASNNVLSALEGIGNFGKGNSLNQSSSAAENLFILVFLGALTVFFFSQKQLIYTVIKPKQSAVIPAYQPQPASQKVLEVDQKTDGTVVVYCLGKEYKISKPELYSESDQFISRLMELAKYTKEMEYITVQDEKTRLTSPLSRLVTRLGFVGIKRDLFFPRTAKDRVLFRRYITQDDLIDMNLSAEQIITEMTQNFLKLN